MTTDRRMLDTRDLAAKLGMSLSAFRKRLKRLRTEHGFPAPVECLGNRWDSRAIDLWLDHHLAAGDGPGSTVIGLTNLPAPANGDLSADERELIDAARHLAVSGRRRH